MKTERRYIVNKACPVTIRAAGDGKPELIGGLAAVYYDGTPATEYVLWEYAGERAIERVLPGAFSDILTEKQDVACLLNHDTNHILGRTSAGTLVLADSAAGLSYQCDPGDTNCGRDTKEHLRRKDIQGSSFSFNVGEQRWTETKGDGGAVILIREIVRVARVWDVGPVCFPAYTSTTASMRDNSDTEEARQSLADFRKQNRSAKASGLVKLLEIHACEL